MIAPPEDFLSPMHDYQACITLGEFTQLMNLHKVTPNKISRKVAPKNLSRNFRKHCLLHADNVS